MKAIRGKCQITYKKTPIRLLAVFSTETQQARREWHDIFKVMKGRRKRRGFDLWVGKMPLEKEMATPLQFLPGKSHGLRSLVGCSLWGLKESDTTEVTRHLCF